MARSANALAPNPGQIACFPHMALLTFPLQSSNPHNFFITTYSRLSLNDVRTDLDIYQDLHCVHRVNRARILLADNSLLKSEAPCASVLVFAPTRI